jgi:hypothetical protein
MSRKPEAGSRKTESAQALPASGFRLPASSLVIQTSFLGDVVLTTPLLAELASRGPVDVVVTPQAAPLLVNHPAVRDVIAFDKRGADDGLGGLWRFARALRTRADGTSRGTTAAYMAQGSWRSAALALFAGISDAPREIPRRSPSCRTVVASRGGGRCDSYTRSHPPAALSR